MRPAAGPGEGAGGAGVPQPRRSDGAEGRGAARGGPCRAGTVRRGSPPPTSAPRLPCAAPRPDPVFTSRPASAGCRGRDGPNPARRPAHLPGPRPPGRGAAAPTAPELGVGAEQCRPALVAPHRPAEPTTDAALQSRLLFRSSAPRPSAPPAPPLFGPAARAGAAAQRCRLRMAMRSWWTAPKLGRLRGSYSQQRCIRRYTSSGHCSGGSSRTPAGGKDGRGGRTAAPVPRSRRERLEVPRPRCPLTLLDGLARLLVAEVGVGHGAQAEGFPQQDPKAPHVALRAVPAWRCGGQRGMMTPPPGGSPCPHRSPQGGAGRCCPISDIPQHSLPGSLPGATKVPDCAHATPYRNSEPRGQSTSRGSASCPPWRHRHHPPPAATSQSR